MESIIDRLRFDPSEAALFVDSARYFLIRPETLAALGRAAGDQAGEIFFQAGREGGTLAAQSYLAEQNMEPEKAVRHMLRMGGLIGWARMDLVDYDQDGSRFTVEAKSSALSWPGGSGWELLAGIMSGLGEVVFSRRVKVEQAPLEGRPEVRRYRVLGL